MATSAVDLTPAERWLASRSRDERKRLGQWPTPWWACDAVAERAVRGLPAHATVVDPACGDGRFLVAVARHLPGARLVGVDIDPAAIEAAKETCRLAGVTADLRVADGLSDAACPQADLVVGNPPFVRVQRLPKAERERLWGRFETATDKADLYACFAERSLEIAPRIALILPSSFLGLASFRALRERLLRAGLSGVFQLPRDAFEGADLDAVAVFCGQGEDRTAGELGPDGLHATGTLGIGPEAWSVAGALPELPGRPLGGRLRMYMGVVCGDYDRYVRSGKRAPEDRPTCRGKDVRRWVIQRTDEHVWYVPGDMLARKPYVAPKSAEVFDVPIKLVIAGTSGTTIRAAMDEHRLFPLDSCYVGHAGPGDDPWALLGFLLSRPVADWYGARHRAARVKAVELARIPVPEGPWPEVAAAARSADEAALDRAVAAAYARER
jgi:hypothetical protein